MLEWNRWPPHLSRRWIGPGFSLGGFRIAPLEEKCDIQVPKFYTVEFVWKNFRESFRLLGCSEWP